MIKLVNNAYTAVEPKAPRATHEARLNQWFEDQAKELGFNNWSELESSPNRLLELIVDNTDK